MTNKPDKGHKDGSCNVTACQAPLKGTMQGYMEGNFTGGPRLYYCETHCLAFNDWDKRSGDPRRITWDETTGPRIAGIHED